MRAWSCGEAWKWKNRTRVNLVFSHFSLPGCFEKLHLAWRIELGATRRRSSYHLIVCVSTALVYSSIYALDVITFRPSACDYEIKP
jgi:hypothetical protein